MKKYYSRADLIEILKSYQKQIKRGGRDFPSVVLSDLEKSINYVLSQCDPNEAGKGAR